MTPEVIGVDPGATIGGARVRPDGSLVWAQELKDVQNLWSLIWRAQTCEAGLHVVIEDYSAAGSMNRDAKTTIKRVGAFEELCRWHNIAYTIAQPQHRLSAATQAEAAVLALHPNESATSMRNAISAAAHALAWRRRNCGSK
jgi:hypothetical protein